MEISGQPQSGCMSTSSRFDSQTPFDIVGFVQGLAWVVKESILERGSFDAESAFFK